MAQYLTEKSTRKAYYLSGKIKVEMLTVINFHLLIQQLGTFNGCQA